MHNPFIDAALRGDFAETKYFLELGANPSENYLAGTLLQVVIKRNHTNVAILLIEYGAEVDIQDKFGYTPLHQAAMNNNKVLVELFLVAGASPMVYAANRLTAGMLAAQNGYIKLAHRLHPDFVSAYSDLFFFDITLAQIRENQNEPLNRSKADEILFISKLSQLEKNINKN